MIIMMDNLKMIIWMELEDTISATRLFMRVISKMVRSLEGEK